VKRLIARSLFVLGFVSTAVACGNSTPSSEDHCRSRLAGDLVISELMTDPSGADTGREYLELFNASGVKLNLGGMSIYVSAADGTAERSHLLRDATLPPLGYFAVGDARGESIPSWLDDSYGDALGALRNTAGRVGIRCGTLAIDEVTYGSGSKPGHSRELSGAFVPDSAINDTEQNWCDATNSLDGENFGTPGTPNTRCGSGGDAMCRDPQTGAMRRLSTPAPGSVVITEFMADPAAVVDADGEWIEIFAAADLDLNGLEARTASARALLRTEECLRVPAGAFALLARTKDPLANGGLPPVLAEVGLSLGNASGRLSLWTNSGALLDEISWTQQQPGVASQLDPSRVASGANDEASSFCPAREPWRASGDLGTPGAENVACSGGAASRCLDPLTGAPREVVHPSRGQLVISEFMADPTRVADPAGEWIEVYARSDLDLNGLTFSNGGTGARTVAWATCLRLNAGSFAVFARSRDPALNGGLAGVIDTFDFGLSQSAAAQESPHSLALLLDGLEIDRITWLSATAGASTQLSAAKLDGAANDAHSNFCPTPPTRIYGLGDRGSPGAMNAVCP
jgi:Lamin Tail Domain